MNTEPAFVAVGERTGTIEVLLSYRIVELFSEGLYTSPNKAIEELVANSFDAGALRVQVLLSPNLHDQEASIAVIDDGEGMDERGLKQHWMIGVSQKRNLPTLPRSRKQIGKFGIGKLATYVLASRLTHITRRDGNYYSTSMDYGDIDTQVESLLESTTPITLPLRRLTEAQARQATAPWVESAAFRASGMSLFGDGAPDSWTVSIMSSLKPKVHEVRPGVLKWILRTALPLRPDFAVWLNGEKLEPSKADRDPLKTWVLGRDLIELPRPSPSDVTPAEDLDYQLDDEHRFGLSVPGIGRISGYAEAYEELLTGGKSDELGRSHGFFVYVYGRLLNADDGHFGISANELRHGTFGRFRLIVHMDGLDPGLRSNREGIGDGPLLETAQDTLRAIFNAIRPTIDRFDEDDQPAARIARKLAASPRSLARKPIVDLARAVADNKHVSRHLIVPQYDSPKERETFLADLNSRSRDPSDFVTAVSVDFDGTPDDPIVRFATSDGCLLLNGWHPFVSTFHDEFADKRRGQPLELMAMAEVLSEAHLFAIGLDATQLSEALALRDDLLRHLVNESGRQSAISIANALSNARNRPKLLEECVCDAFRSLGYEVTSLGKPGQPDGVGTAYLSAETTGIPRHYKLSLEAKSKKASPDSVTAKDVNLSAVIRHRNRFECKHAVVVAPSFQSSGGWDSALGESIRHDRESGRRDGNDCTITLITIDDLARLVRLRPLKRLGLLKLHDLFRDCSLPDESHDWVASIQQLEVDRPPYRRIVETIETSQRRYKMEPVKYAALRVELSHLEPPIFYETDEEVRELCRAMMQIAPGAVSARADRVELDQSAENVVQAIEAAVREYPPEEAGYEG